MGHDRIDAHHHLWKYSRGEYPWMSDSMDLLRRDFLPEDLAAVLRQSNIDATIAIQARQSVQETEWLLQLAGSNGCIRGVVGWVPLNDPKVSADLEKFAASLRLKGVRHVLHDEPDENYILRKDFNRGIGLLVGLNLRYDILIFERHLPQTIEFVDRHPNQIFVLDHIAKPRIKERIISPWRENISDLARRKNVYCKLSGMVTEADWKNWKEDDLWPYFEVVLEAFGPGRLMWGSDWPVVLVASTYARWIDVSLKMISALSIPEQEAILGSTAIQAYGL
jgi:L-fuconolactonase